MKAFVTGSRVYGTPTKTSDLDIVALVDAETLELLKQVVDKIDTDPSTQEYYKDGMSMRFGRLNLLAITEPSHFEVWKKGTDTLTSIAPVTRETAIEVLDELRRANRIDPGTWTVDKPKQL